MNTGDNLNILQLLITFLGGGMVAIIIQVIFGFFQRKNERYFNFLKEQISLVYAPLYFLIIQNEIIQVVVEEFCKAINKEKNGHEDKMDINFKDSDIISEINGYINEIVDNNKKIKTLLDNYSYLLDFSDLKILEIFLNNFIRLMHDTNGKLGASNKEKFHMGKTNISLIDPELNKQIKNAFLEKQEKYKKLYR